MEYVLWNKNWKSWVREEGRRASNNKRKRRVGSLERIIYIYSSPPLLQTKQTHFSSFFSPSFEEEKGWSIVIDQVQARTHTVFFVLSVCLRWFCFCNSSRDSTSLILSFLTLFVPSLQEMERKYENQGCECDVEKKKKEPVHVVLQMDLHCDGCISRIVRLAGSLEGL